MHSTLNLYNIFLFTQLFHVLKLNWCRTILVVCQVFMFFLCLALCCFGQYFCVINHIVFLSPSFFTGTVAPTKEEQHQGKKITYLTVNPKIQQRSLRDRPADVCIMASTSCYCVDKCCFTPIYPIVCGSADNFTISYYIFS